MALYVIEAATAQELEIQLRGGVVGGVDLRKRLQGGKLFGLDGLTLLINGAPVIFADPLDTGLSLLDIKTQVELANPNVVVTYLDGKFVIASLVGNITIGLAGTINPVFGFSGGGPKYGYLYAAPDGPAPRFITIGPGPHKDSYMAVVER